MMVVTYILALLFSVALFTFELSASPAALYQDSLGNRVYRLNLANDSDAESFSIDGTVPIFNDYTFDVEENKNSRLYICPITSKMEEQLIKLVRDGVRTVSSDGEIGVVKPHQLFEISKRSRRRGPMDFYSHMGRVSLCRNEETNLSLTFYDDDLPSGEMLVMIKIPTLPQPLIFNKHDFGNFLWGAAMSLTGTPEFVAKGGAHVNSKLNAAKDNSKIIKGELDSPSDQAAIGYGYLWADKLK